MLGLGLGLNKGGYVKPLPKWLTDAGCTFAINVDRQVKALANPNSPFTNPLVDITKKGNNVTLQSFAGTTADGYRQEVAPNGRTVWGLKGDGVDSYGLMGANPPNPVGTQDFGFAFVFKTGATLPTQFIYFRGLNGVNLSENQFSILPTSDGAMVIRLAGTAYKIGRAHV